MLARIIFALVHFAARKGLAEESAGTDVRRRARRTGVRGETYAYWYLRRHGYILIARNYTAPGVKGEIDLIGYDGPVLVFIEVKTRTGERDGYGRPEDAVTPDKMHALRRMARQFLAERCIPQAPCRFDVLAIESPPRQPPAVRLHKGAFSV